MRITIPRLTPVFALILVAASCGSNSDNITLGAASGNTLSEAQIDAALGPANQSSAAATAQTNRTTENQPTATD